jgi:PAS domain-containing protein
LSLILLLTVLLVLTNEFHGLMWRDIIWVGLQRQATFSTWFWVHAVYSYGAFLIAIVLLVIMFLQAPLLYRWQAGLMAIGGLVPWTASLLYSMILPFVPGLDSVLRVNPTPFAFVITGITFTWCIFRFQLFDIMPVAREAILENMVDGILVLDDPNRVEDINPAAQTFLEVADSTAIGRHVAEVLPA